MSNVSCINIAAAIVAAQQSAQAVEKTSANGFHKYRYASAEAMITEARQALSSAGLALITMNCELQGKEHIHVCYRLFHVSGEFLDFTADTPVIEEKGRPLDKAVATAMTYNLGYFLRGLLLLPRVEEGTDVDQRDDRKHEPAKPDALADDLAKSLFETFSKKLSSAAHDALPALAAEIKSAKLPTDLHKALVTQYQARKAQNGASNGAA